VRRRMQWTSWCLPVIAAGMFLSTQYAAAQTNCNEGAGPLSTDQPQDISVADIIQKLSAHESEFKEAQTRYGYNREVLVQTLTGNVSDGEYRRVSHFSYKQGKPVEDVLLSPQSTLRSVTLTKEDFDDIERSPFVLTREGLPEYNVNYIGRQKVDALDTYVFDVAPKEIVKNKRYFQGRIWVENRDLALVKSCGKNVPENPEGKQKKRSWTGRGRGRGKGQSAQENVAPTLVTYREQFEHRYWFPIYVRSESALNLQSTDAVHVLEVIKYTEYQRADASSGAAGNAQP
jgi:hypothetical protein